MVLDKDHVLAILRAHEAELHGRGVRRVALFGSVARGEAQADSDTDILVELDPDPRHTSFGYAGVKRSIAGLFPGPVDVTERPRLRDHLRSTVDADAIYAF